MTKKKSQTLEQFLNKNEDYIVAAIIVVLLGWAAWALL
jgi:hypothetical protein